jgi:hypothetical protein
MAKIGRSARGELVDFDIMSIKQALANKPVNVGVDNRRRFIDAKDGVKSPIQYALKDADISAVPSALQMAFTAAQSSASIIDEAGVVDEIIEPIAIDKVSVKDIKI